MIRKIFFYFLVSLMLGGMSIYDIKFEDSRTNHLIDMSDYKGKVIMLVNTASLCGFTKQYADMQKIWKDYKDRGFILIALPTNDFGGQEPGADREILEFCTVNFGAEFLITKKIFAKGESTHDFFKLIKQDFGNLATPKWNFFKYIYSSEGVPLKWFSSIRTPSSQVVRSVIEKNLP